MLKRFLSNIIFFVILFALTFFFLVRGENVSEIAEVITGLISRRKSIENKLAKEKIRLLWQKPKQP